VFDEGSLSGYVVLKKDLGAVNVEIYLKKEDFK
jgi:hypothetical protein